MPPKKFKFLDHSSGKITAAWKPNKWNVDDFAGKYHVKRMQAKAHIPGTQTTLEETRANNEEKRAEVLDTVVSEIAGRHANYAKVKFRHARAESIVNADAKIRDTMEEVSRVVQQIASLDLLETKKHGQHVDEFDNPEEASSFLQYVATGDHFNVTKMLKTGFQGIDVQDSKHEECGLHIAVRQGDLEMVKLLLRYHAKPDLKNRVGDAPLHNAWRFWSPDHYQKRNGSNLQARETCKEEEQLTCKLLLEVLRARANPSERRSEGSTALHEAARRGPVQAVVVLLQFKADHEAVNEVGHSPLFIAKAANNHESARLIASWRQVKQVFEESEFTNIWTEFCRNPEASLIRGKPAAETLTDLVLMDHQETLKRERHAGIKVVDEVVTEMRNSITSEGKADAKTKKPTLSQEKNDSARARLLPPGSKERLLSVPIDKYLRAEVQVNFRESGKQSVKKGSFAYANQSRLQGKCTRSVAALSKKDENDDDAPDLPFSSSTRRKLNVATLLADGEQESYTYRPATVSKLLRSVRQSHSLHRAISAEEAKQGELVTKRKLTAREQYEQSNPVQMKMKHARNYDDSQTNDLFENVSRRAQFNEDGMIPESFKAPVTWEDTRRTSTRTRPMAGMTYHATREPWSTVTERYALQIAGGPPKQR